MSGAAPGFALFRLTISDGGTLEVMERRLATWGLEVQDLSSAWQLIGERLLADNMQNLVGEGSLYAGGWAQLRPSTIADRLRRGYGAGPIEWRTGTLARSLAMQGAAGNVFEVTPASVTVGSDVAYAGYQHYGTGRMPARALVGASWDTRSYMVKVLADTIREKARNAGLVTYED